MWAYLRPVLIIVVILGGAFLLTRSCVDSTGPGYYSHHYPGGVFIGGYYHVPRGTLIRRGK